MGRMAFVLALALGYCLGSSRGDVFTVTTANLLGAGSLTEAIEGANANPGADTIAFNIPGPGVHTINIVDIGLPEINDTVTVDGYTQPGASANTLGLGDNAVILIRIDGTPSPLAAPSAEPALIISGSDSLVRGVALTGFARTSESNAIILKGAGGHTVEGSFVGLSSDQLRDAGNSNGIRILSSNNKVGGMLPATRNVISGNTYGITIDAGASSNLIQGNDIGIDPETSGDLANLLAGVSVSGSGNLIGGLDPGSANRIWFNSTGVRVVEGGSGDSAVENSILSNSISAPAAKIDLIATDIFGGDFDGATRNDLDDADTGPNELQNYPIITSTAFLQDRTTVRGGLNSTPGTTFTLQFFTEGLRANESGLVATKTITTNAAGLAYFEFDFQPLPFDLTITATATDPAGNTSEYRADFEVQLANISARGQVGLADDLLIGGFVVHEPPFSGPVEFSKKVLVRALGPSLGASLPERLADPILQLYDASGVLIAANDNWRSDQEAQISATGAQPASDAEAALIADLPQGSYTVQMRGANGTTGTGVVEVYDLDPLDPFGEPPSGRLVNISARALVGRGDDILIGGLIVRGDAGQYVLMRAIGPDLSALQIPNALPDPTLELRDGSGTLLASNDNWRDDEEAQIVATGLAPNDDRDSAVIFALIPGSYTAIVRGAAESSGVALVEIYDLNFDH